MKALFIIAPRYQDFEYNVPKKIFELAEIEVITASKNSGLVKGALGGTAQAQISLSEAEVKDYELILFVGGPGAVDYQQDEEAHKIAQEAVKQNKILAAICIAPTILAYAGVLNGKKATVWNDDGLEEDILKENGATFTGEKVTVDGKIITANGPRAAEEFAKKILILLIKK